MSKVLRWTIGLTFVTYISGLIFISCSDDFHIGESKEEIYRQMFEVDSIIMRIQMQIDSTNMEFEKFYIDAQRINNGHG